MAILSNSVVFDGILKIEIIVNKKSKTNYYNNPLYVDLNGNLSGGGTGSFKSDDSEYYIVLTNLADSSYKYKILIRYYDNLKKGAIVREINIMSPILESKFSYKEDLTDLLSNSYSRICIERILVSDDNNILLNTINTRLNIKKIAIIETLKYYFHISTMIIIFLLVCYYWLK